MRPVEERLHREATPLLQHIPQFWAPKIAMKQRKQILQCRPCFSTTQIPNLGLKIMMRTDMSRALWKVELKGKRALVQWDWFATVLPDVVLLGVLLSRIHPTNAQIRVVPRLLDPGTGSNHAELPRVRPTKRHHESRDQKGQETRNQHIALRGQEIQGVLD